MAPERIAAESPFRRCLLLSVCIPVIALVPVPASAAWPFVPRIALHVTTPPVKASTTCRTGMPDIPCTEFTSAGDAPAAHLVYLVTAEGSPDGVLGLSCGLDYDQAAGQGLDIFQWTFCADGIEYPHAGANGEWPASGSGNRLTQVACQEDVDVNVWGAFYVYAYGDDDLQITPNLTYSKGPELQVVGCDHAVVDLSPSYSAGRAAFSSGAAAPGYNPCLNGFTGCQARPSSYNFGLVPVGESKDWTFTVINLIEPPGGLNLEGDIHLDCSPEFRILQGEGPYSLPAGGSLPVTVRFTPTAEGPASCSFETGCQTVRMTGAGGVPTPGTPKVALHVRAPVSKAYSECAYPPTTPCSQYETRADVGVSRDIYLVVGQGGTATGIVALSCGIDYDGRPRSGVDVLHWTYCDGLEFLGTGPNGEWPAAGGGLRLNWVTCREDVIPPDGIHVVAGAFYVHAYSEDDFSVTANRTLLSGPEFVISTCLNEIRALSPETDAGTVAFSPGAVRAGRNPCLPNIEAADVRFDPGTLNAAAGSPWMTASIELPSGFDVGDIDAASVRLQGLIRPDPDAAPGSVGDFNSNGIPDVTFRFDRAAFIETLPPEDDVVAATVTGEISGGVRFNASGAVGVVRPRMIAPNGGESFPAGSQEPLLWENPPGWGGTCTASLFYSEAAEPSWTLITDAAEEGRYLWEVPDRPMESVRIRVEVSDTFGLLGRDETDGTFTVTGAGGEGEVPYRNALLQNIPNPFTESTRIRFTLRDASPVLLRVFGVTGARVRVLVDDASVPAGGHEAVWDGRDGAGRPAGLGVYLVELRAGAFRETRRMLLVR